MEHLPKYWSDVPWTAYGNSFSHHHVYHECQAQAFVLILLPIVRFLIGAIGVDAQVFFKSKTPDGHAHKPHWRTLADQGHKALRQRIFFRKSSRISLTSINVMKQNSLHRKISVPDEWISRSVSMSVGFTSEANWCWRGIHSNPQLHCIHCDFLTTIPPAKTLRMLTTSPKGLAFCRAHQ